MSDIKLHPNVDAVGVVDPDGELSVFGTVKGRYGFASVTKLLTTQVIADAVASGFVSFDDWVNDEYFNKGQVSLSDLLSHSSGIRPDHLECVAPREKRIYTNEAFELAGNFVMKRLGADFENYAIGDLFEEGLGLHLNSTIKMNGSCAHSANGSFEDLLAFAQEIRQPTFLEPQIHSQLVKPYLPELSGVLPGWGNYDRNEFGIGYEIKGDKSPHWTGSKSSPQTYGHFGQSGVFVFHDPVNMITASCVTNHDFGPWSKEAFPKMCDDIYEKIIG